jgi:hypothetical protein
MRLAVSRILDSDRRFSRRAMALGFAAGRDGIDFVRCRICGERRRIISSRHLSKHDIDRESYLERCGLSPDELIAKDFRQIQSSRRGYHPYNKGEWIRAVKEVYSRKGKVSTKYLQRRHAEIYYEGVWLFGGWDEALRAAGFDPEKIRVCTSWTREKIITEVTPDGYSGLVA